MDAKVRVRWQKLVDSFDMGYLAGLRPWDALVADGDLTGRSDAEKAVVRFLLAVWNPNHEWQVGRFDLFDALGTWDGKRRLAFLAWVQDPWWP